MTYYNKISLVNQATSAQLMGSLPKQGLFSPEKCLPFPHPLQSSFWIAFYFLVQQLPHTICWDCSTKPRELANEDP